MERDGVLVGRDAGPGECGLRLLAEEADRSKIEQHHVGVGAAADDPDPAVGERGGERSRVLDDALPVDLELRAKSLPEAHRLGGEDVGVEASLDAGKHRGLKAFGELVRACEDEPAPGARAASWWWCR